ncbi:MAG TPA: GMC family oxidoreductase [Bryobacteraceae bacterium]|nr:GMC family oxidoreductase [Bryobacteraceae bacterium]
MSRAPYPPNHQVDFVVVGSGAAGGAVAKELAVAGFEVVVLEQGPYLRPKDFRHDEILVRNLHQLTNDPNRQPQTYRKTESEVAKVQQSAGYGRAVGGGTLHFTANWWRLHEIDFNERSRFGPVPNAALEDWPITYQELEPYYTKSEQDIGVSGLGGSNPFDAPRSKPYPLPPMPVKSSGVLFDRGAKKLGLHPFPAPVAILSQQYKGRPGCVHCGFCMAFGCEVGAKSSTMASLIPMAERTGNCEIRPESYVRKIETDGRGRVTGAIYFDKNKKEVFQKAKAVVVCANGVESPRLLLMSKSNRFPNGLANSSGLVGKYLMYDNGTSVTAMFDEPLNEFKSVLVTRVLHDFYDSDPKRGFYGGGGIDARSNSSPVQFGLRGNDPSSPRWGSAWKKSIAYEYPRTMALFSHITCLPMESNNVTLDPELKDEWGMPALRLTFKNHPDDLKTMEFILERQKEIMEAAGAKKIWPRPVREVNNSVHLMGTCRMGNDPKRSVVNKFNRAHDVPNLFVVDGSSMVSSGRQQPTCTIQALGYWAADHMIQAAKRGEI